jgi:hypothetical protein
MRAQIGLMLLTSSVLVLGGACGGGSSGGGQTIGASGGTVSKSGVTLTIPAGALSADTAITVATTTAPPGYTLASAAYVFGPAGTIFAKPVTVSIPLAAVEEARLFWSNTSGGFDDLGGTVSGTTLTGKVMHFSIGFAAKAAPDGGAAGNDGAVSGAGGGAAGPGGGNAGADSGTAGADGPAAPDAVTDADAMPAAPTPTVIVTLQTYSLTIAADSTYLYWVDHSGNNLLRAPKAGGIPTVAYQPPIRPMSGQRGLLYETLAVDDTSAYVVTPNDELTTSLLKVAKDGSTQTEPRMVTFGNGPNGREIAIDSQNVYFEVNNGGVDSVPINGGVNDNGVLTTVVNPNGPGGTLAPSPVDPILGTPIGWNDLAPNSLITDGTNVYYAEEHWILKAPVGGGALTILVPDLASAGGGEGYVLAPSGLPSVSGGYVYWCNYGYVYKVPVGGGTPEALVSQSAGDLGYTVSDGKSVYYLSGGSLWKIPVTGGAPTSLIDPAKGFVLGGPAGNLPMIVDETSVYVLAYNGMAIVKIAK